MKTQTKQTFKTHSDIGSVSVFTKDAKWHFGNDWGDGENTVEVFESKISDEGLKFKSSFSVFTEAFLASYDCEPHEAIYTFQKGRWFVFVKSPGHMVFVRM